MKSFMTMLNESLDTGVSWEKKPMSEYETGRGEKEGNKEYAVPFVINDGKKIYRYQVLFTPLSSTDKRYTVMYAIREIEDMKTGEIKKLDPVDDMEDSIKRVRFDENKIARAVMSTVLDVVQYFFEQVNPRYMQSEIRDRHDDRLESTTSLFRKVLNRMGKTDQYTVSSKRSMGDWITISAEEKT